MSIKKANLQITAKKLAKMAANGEATFNNAIQRGFCWDENRSSLLIHSMMVGYPIPPFYAVKHENGKGYDFLDGKQRSTSIVKFLNDEFALKGVPPVSLDDIDDELELNGLKFSELPEEAKDAILDYSFTTYYFESITEEEINEMFWRLNNGKPLTAIELTRVKAKSQGLISTLSKHELFTGALSEAAINRYTNEDIVIKSWLACFTDKPTFITKDLRKLTETIDISDEQEQHLIKCFDLVKAACDLLRDSKDKATMKAYKRCLTKTHLITTIVIASECVNNNIQYIMLANWIEKFFGGTGKATTISQAYNAAAVTSSAKPEQIKTRHVEAKSFFAEISSNYQEPNPSVDEHVIEKVTQTKEESAPSEQVDEATDELNALLEKFTD